MVYQNPARIMGSTAILVDGFSMCCMVLRGYKAMRAFVTMAGL